MDNCKKSISPSIRIRHSPIQSEIDEIFARIISRHWIMEAYLRDHSLITKPRYMRNQQNVYETCKFYRFSKFTLAISEANPMFNPKPEASR